MHDTDLNAQLERARALVGAATRIVAFTGAGISAESGVPTFRGPGGLWRGRDPMSLATPEAFRADPALVWAWYAWRRDLVRGCDPNAAHVALAALEVRLGDGFTLVTQNVDGLHRRAGSERVLELHGALFVNRCSRCGASHVSDVAPTPPLPRCGACGALERPGVVWFGEPLSEPVLAAASHAAESCDVILVVGTSGVVYPAAGLVWQARRAGASVIVVNAEPSPHTEIADVVLYGAAAALLPGLVAA